jgi:hypothetical protein
MSAWNREPHEPMHWHEWLWAVMIGMIVVAWLRGG